SSFGVLPGLDHRPQVLGLDVQGNAAATAEYEATVITHPDKVQEVAREYVDAGSRVILTNTFGANRYALGKFGLADEVAEININGVDISRRAAGTKAYVFASMGPTGKLLATREVTENDLQQAFEEQAQAMAKAAPDAIVVETMMDLTEARIAATAAKQTGLPVVACLVFDSGRLKDRTMMGNTVEQAVEVLSQLEVDAIGANCGQGIEGFIPICKRMRAATELPLWMKPNAGRPETVDGQAVYTTTAQDFVRFVPELIQAGANFIGSCCGSEPAFIREIGKTLRKP
ncbi:MAG TPA: homocysteine S-methyltransferase family protein, partial [Dehalococcoidia bacterium]|nr:homocysteine S-methyltransferase family protein [Dehalococcoidia bacterium]